MGQRIQPAGNRDTLRQAARERRIDEGNHGMYVASDQAALTPLKRDDCAGSSLSA